MNRDISEKINATVTLAETSIAKTIPVEKSREFLEEANKNCLSLEFLSQCKESSNLFNFID